MAEHDAFIKNEHQGVDHGLKGVVSIEDAMKKNDLKAIEAIQVRADGGDERGAGARPCRPTS